ncbi:MAG: linear amide C-N hydrolase [Bacteroidales bacterium]|nr:linear amide C-N hydrolase [Bacteroidales bacterium]
MKKTLKKTLKITLFGLLGIVAVAAVCVWAEFGALVKGALSVQKLDDGLYYMEYSGDDGWDKLMEQGGFANANQLSQYAIHFLSKGHVKMETQPQEVAYGCSALTARTPEGDVLMGRNFDFDSATGMILRTRPTHGYASITTFNVEFFGFASDYQPEGFGNQYLALSCLFVALDGINERGLAVADLMAGDTVQTHQQNGLPDLTTTGAIRYMLNKAATVEEALALLRSIDMHSDIGSAHHYAISDASGRSVVVEYVDDEMVVTETPAVTNHYLCDAKKDVGLYANDDRYDRLCSHIDPCNGVMERAALTEAIQEVSQEGAPDKWLGTAWTMVMDLSHPSVTYYARRHFDRPFTFEL